MRQAEERLPEEGASKQKLKRGWLQRKAGRKGTVDVARATQMSKGHTGNGAGQPRLCHSTGLPQSTLTTFLGLSLPTCREETLAAAFSQGPEDSGHLGQPQGGPVGSWSDEFPRAHAYAFGLQAVPVMSSVGSHSPSVPQCLTLAPTLTC